MPLAKNIPALRSLIANSLDENAVGDKLIAGVIGDAPSQYSKSPALWNAAFDHLAMNAIYLPLDVADARVGELLQTLRRSDRFMGINVTVPHKVRVIEFLDELDPAAQRIQAVNTIVKNPDGKLIGYNTDGEGFIDSLLLAQPGQEKAFLKSLDGINVLLLGAGGSARAVAFHVSDHIGKGQLIIANRTREHAESLAREIAKLGRQAVAIDESEIPKWAPQVGLIVNSTTKGQGGIRRLVNGMATMLEPYSSLASANPPILSAALNANFEQQWLVLAQADIEANNGLSESLAQSIPQDTRFYDLIYHPEETVFLRHGRMMGHRTMNGKNMIVCQAAIAFSQCICRQQLHQLGKDDIDTRRRISEVMHASW
jgi:shikimate dehydrogenase